MTVDVDIPKTSIAELPENVAFMPDHLWDERETIAKRVIDNYVPTLPWRDRLEFARRLKDYRSLGCDEHLAVLCSVVMLTPEKAYGFNIQEWTQ